MAVYMAHAQMDENGKVDGPRKGDQTGKEICVATYYAKNKSGAGWETVLFCTDPVFANEFATIAEQIARNDSFGYSQPNRFSGYAAIKANGGKIAGAVGDFDCTSLVIVACILAGLNIKAEGYSGNLERILVSSGKFVAKKDSKYLESDKYLERGCVLLRVSHGHAAVVLGNGSLAGSSSSGASKPAAAIPSGDPIGAIRIDADSWVNVRSLPSDASVKLGKASADALYAIYGVTSDGWYKVKYGSGYGYIHNSVCDEVGELGDTLTITGGSVYIRAGGSASAARLGTAYAGERFVYAGETLANGWNKIEYKGGAAYVSGKYSVLDI